MKRGTWIIIAVVAIVVVLLGAAIIYCWTMPRSNPHPTPGGESFQPMLQCGFLGPVCQNYETGVPTVLKGMGSTLCPPGKEGATNMIIQAKTPDGHSQYISDYIHCKDGQAVFNVPSNVNFYPGDMIRWSIMDNSGEEKCVVKAPIALTRESCLV